MFSQRTLLLTVALASLLALAMGILACPWAWSQDCDRNGIADELELVGPFRMADSDVRTPVGVEPRAKLNCSESCARSQPPGRFFAQSVRVHSRSCLSSATKRHDALLPR